MRRTDHILETIPSGTFVEEEGGQRLYLPRYDRVSVYGAVNTRLDPEVILDKAVVKDAPGPIGPEVTFVGATTANYITSGTSISQTLPEGVQEGDHIIAILMHRATTITPPSDGTWNFLIRSPGIVTLGTQYAEAWHKIVEADDIGSAHAFGGNISGRMALVFVVLRSNVGLIALEDSNSTSAAGTTIISAPALTSGGEGRFFIAAASATLAQVSGGNPVNTDFNITTPGVDQYTASTIPDNRLCVGGAAKGEGDTGVVAFQHQSPNNNLNAISLLFRPEEA